MRNQFQWKWCSYRIWTAQVPSVQSISEWGAAQWPQLINERCRSHYKCRWAPIGAMGAASVKWTLCLKTLWTDQQNMSFHFSPDSTSSKEIKVPFLNCIISAQCHQAGYCKLAGVLERLNISTGNTLFCISDLTPAMNAPTPDSNFDTFAKGIAFSAASTCMGFCVFCKCGKHWSNCFMSCMFRKWDFAELNCELEQDES